MPSEADQLLEQCPCSLFVQLQPVLPSWVFEHRTFVAHAHHGHLVGSQEVTHASVLHDVWASQSKGMACSMPRGARLFNPPCSGVVGLGKAAVQEGITEETTQLCLSPSFQRKCPLEYQLLAEMVTEAHQSYTAALMLN